MCEVKKSAREEKSNLISRARHNVKSCRQTQGYEEMEDLRETKDNYVYWHFIDKSCVQTQEFVKWRDLQGGSVNKKTNVLAINGRLFNGCQKRCVPRANRETSEFNISIGSWNITINKLTKQKTIITTLIPVFKLLLK